MINTLLEHVPIKMEVQEIETNSIPVNPPQNERMAKDDEEIDETDEDMDADASDDEDEDVDEEDDEEEDEEESDIETDALEIEKEATMLISSDEEAELEAQRIRFPDIAKKLRRDSNNSSRSSTRSSQTSYSSSNPQITYEIVKQKDCTIEETNNKQRISPRLKHMESYNKEKNNKTSLLKQKTENKNLENNKSLESNKSKPDESANKRLDNNKTTTEILHKNSENNRNKENILISPVNVPGQKCRRGSNNSTCSVASTVTSDSAETESCGNIYVFNLEQKLIFNCEFCDLKYGDLDNFGLHLHEAHKLFNFDEDPEKENAPRNLGKTNRLSINAPKNCANIKKEPLNCVELKAESPVALPPSALAEPLDSCGNVFMLNHRKLFLFCGYCECKYANLELFEKHLRQQHRIFEGCHNEVNVVPKVEVKEEIICEVADKPDIIAPQAMVAIPAEIPLDISITPENEHETAAALQEIAVEEQLNAQMEEDRVETAVLKEAPTQHQTADLEIIAAGDKETALEEIVEPVLEANKEPSISTSLGLESNKTEMAIDKQNESSNEINMIAVIENEISENKEKPFRRKAKNKRKSSSDEQLESPNKRPKRTTRNNTRNEQESLAANEKLKLCEKAENVLENVNCAELPETKQANYINKTIKTIETFKETSEKVTKPQKTKKSTISLEAEKSTHLKKTPTRELRNTTDSENTTAENEEIKKLKDSDNLKLTETRETSKTKELENAVKLTETIKTSDAEKKTAVKLTETRETSKTKELENDVKLTETIKTSDAEKKTAVKLTETTKIKETEKTTSPKLTTNRETKKVTEPEKTIAVKLTEKRVTRKTPDSEGTTSTKLPEATDTIKTTDPEKTAVKLTEKRQGRKTTDTEKKTSLKLKATRKTTNLEKTTALKLRERRKTTDPEETTSLKSIETIANRKTPELEKTAAVKLKETREKRKVLEPEKATIETIANRKTPEREKMPAVKLKETREKRKALEPEKTKSHKITEARETRKTLETEKTKTVNLIETRETRKTSDPEKTKTLNSTETRETRNSAKLAASKKPAEAVEPKKQLPSETTAIKEVIKPANSPESKILEDVEKSNTKYTILKCSICFKEFTKKKSLVWHERTHHFGSNRRYGCGICGQDFLVENERKTHMQTRHNVDTLLQCSKCYRAFSSKRDLKRHNDKVHVAKLYKCGECLRTYSSEAGLKSHIYVYHPNNKRTTAGKNKKKSSGKLNLSKTKPKESLLVNVTMPEVNIQQDDNIKNVVKADQAEELLEELKNVGQEMAIENSSVIYAISYLPLNAEQTVSDSDLNAKPIDIIDAQLSNEVLENPTEKTVQTVFVADLNTLSADHVIQQLTNEIEVDKPLESADLINVTNDAPVTAKLTFAKNSEEDDLTADPVDDIIEQLQNELAAESSSESTTTSTNNVVTYTINALPNRKETEKSVVLDAQLNVLDKTEDVKPSFLKIVKHFVCDVCSKTYYKHSRLIEHKRLHTGEKPYGCDECGKQFRVRNRLNEHKQRHSKEKKFKCEICQLPLCTRQDYNLHMRHHSNDRRYQCSVCPKAFVRSSDLKIHERIHTGEKPYVCDVCHKCFRANQNLSVHKKSHMGDISKTFKCDHCDKKFMRKIDRKVHMRTHTGEKPYKCEICQRGYSSRVNVRAHIDRDHIKGAQEEKKKPGPKPRSLREELERQKKLIEELQNQLLQQIKSDEKIILSEEEMQGEHILPDSPVKASSPITTTTIAKSDPVQSAYKLLNKLKASSSVTTTTTTSKSLTLIPSPTPLEEPSSTPLTTKAKKDSTTTILPLTLTQKLEQASPAPSTSSASTSCLTTPSPPPTQQSAAKTTATKIVSQKTALGIQQVSVTVSMQVENVTANSNTVEKDNSQIISPTSSGATSVKKERKITSYFTVLDQKSKG